MYLDFLNTLKNGVAAHHVAVAALIPGLLILLLTLWGGRIFCGWICPLGTCIDITDRLLFRRGRLFYNPKRGDTQRFRNWKYVYLLVGLGALAFGVDILAFGDPLSLITRAFTLGLYGPVAYTWNGGLGLLERIGVSRGIFSLTGLDIGGWRIATAVFFSSFSALLLFFGVLGLGFFQERFWCRNLCPYGGLLALVSRFSWLRHSVRNDTCIHCVKCENLSRMGAYENLDKRAKEPIRHAIAECIQCFRCETICPPNSIQIEVHRPEWLGGGGQKKEAPGPQPEFAPQTAVHMGRRHVIGALAAGVFMGAAAVASAGNYQGRMRKYARNERAMRPPGALPEDQFLSACTRCAECMKVCPTNALQPALLETGPEGIWTPILVPAIGPCAEKCTACGDVCPTEAIRPFTWQDKRYKLKLGLAVVNQSTCIAWSGGRECVVCAEVCPYSAVVFRDKMDDGLPKDPTRPISEPGNKGRMKRVPTVDERLCTGCGICEYHCPVIPQHAIYVATSQEDRDYRPPRQPATHGLVRPDWEKRKGAGKDREYAATKQAFQERVEIMGPGAGNIEGAGF
jgi:ferredoxin-type protein NapF